MKKLFYRIVALMLVLSALCTATVQAADTKVKTRQITDMAGRKLEIPVDIKKAYATSQIGIIVLYTLNPDKLAGWGFALNDEDKKYIYAKYYKLPVLGVWSGKNGTGNIEQIIKVHPDVIFSTGTIDDSQITLCNRIQQQTGIPVVMVDGALEKQDKTYEMVGDLINEKSNAKALADYCKSTISTVKEAVAKIPQDKKVKVYYAEGLKGLETDPKGSFHTEVLDLVGGINIAEVPALSGFGRATVSPEQLLMWNPDVIIAGYDKDAVGGGYESILKNPDIKNVNAIKNKRVYEIPCRPFDWFDRPPSTNRIIGVKWLANLLYPQYVKIDIKAEVKKYYKLFYHKSLNDNQIEKLLKKAK